MENYNLETISALITDPTMRQKVTELYEKEECHENYLRQRAKKREIPLDKNDEISFKVECALSNLQNSTEEQAYQNWLKSVLRIAIKQLEAEEKLIIGMLFYLELPEAKIAKHFAVSQQAIHKRKKKILNKLKTHLKKYFDESGC